MSELTSQFYDMARDFALQTHRNLFITGKAGTGKTTFLHQLKMLTQKQIAIVAPTGVAAINAGGTTMHSFFQLPFTPFLPTAFDRKQLIEKVKMRSQRRKILQDLELLVIDEISMVRADTLDAIDTILRHVRFNHQEAFGGVQVIFIGDLFQLSPVVSESEWALLSSYYKSPYFFQSHVIQQQAPVYIELDTIFRQTDQDFVEVLNEVRNNQLSPKGMALLKSRYNPLFVPQSDEGYITLTTHNYKADRINAEELANIEGPVYSFAARIEGEFNEKSYPTEKNLELKIGAKVMLIKNDTEIPRRFYNGKIGIISDIHNEEIIIDCHEDNSRLAITPMEWENIRYSTNPTTKQIEEQFAGKFVQYPLRLAWAITIHKSQGLTFDKAVIDAGEAFAAGQVYVALSRCRSLEGMILLSKIHPQSIENDPEIVAHQQQKPLLNQLESELDESRRLFRSYLLQQIFEFQGLSGRTERLIRFVNDEANSFNDETMPFLREIKTQINELTEVGARFQQQITKLLHAYEMDEHFLMERIDAAIHYFQPKLRELMDTLKNSPAMTDNKQNAEEYNDALRAIYGDAALQVSLMRKMSHPFQSEEYFSIKQAFVVPDFSVNAYAKNNSAKTFSVAHPQLYFQLSELRNNICDNYDIPVYLVASSKSIQEMANYLPLNEKELMQIHGFGKAKSQRYGKQFLEVLNNYCLQMNLSSRMSEKPTEQKPSKKRKSKVASG